VLNEEDKLGSVYFIAAPALQIVKIGFTQRTVDKRLGQLKSNSPPIDLKIIGRQNGTKELEAVYHYCFRKTCVKGEWFEYEPVIVLAALGLLVPTKDGSDLRWKGRGGGYPAPEPTPRNYNAVQRPPPVIVNRMMPPPIIHKGDFVSFIGSIDPKETKWYVKHTASDGSTIFEDLTPAEGRALWCAQDKCPLDFRFLQE
jgi:hypothetical protein